MRRMKSIVFVLCLIPLLLFVYIAVLSRIDPEKDPRYSHFDLHFSSPQESALFKRLLYEQPPFQYRRDLPEDLSYELRTTSITDGKKARDPNGWYADLAKAHRILSKHRPYYPTALLLLQEKGCFPLPPPQPPPTQGTDKPKPKTNKPNLPRPSMHPLLTALKMISSQALADAQSSHPDRSASHLAAALSLILRIEQQCPNTLVYEMSLLISMQILSETTPFLLSQPTLSPASRQILLQAMKQHAVLSPQSLARVWKVENHSIQQEIKALPEFQTNGLSWPAWPFLDKKQFFSWQDESSRHKIWLSLLPLPFDPPRTKWDDFSDKLRSSSNVRTALSYNSVGRILFSIASPSTVRYVHKWHQHRCLANFHLARALHHGGHNGPLPTNPLTQKPFDLQSTRICGVKTTATPKNNALPAEDILPSLPVYPWPTSPPPIPPKTTTPTQKPILPTQAPAPAAPPKKITNFSDAHRERNAPKDRPF